MSERVIELVGGGENDGRRVTVPWGSCGFNVMPPLPPLSLRPIEEPIVPVTIDVLTFRPIFDATGHISRNDEGIERWGFDAAKGEK